MSGAVAQALVREVAVYSQCPVCATVFRLDDALAESLPRQVRCSMCAHVFDPQTRYAESLPREFLAHVSVPATEVGVAADVDGGQPQTPAARELPDIEVFGVADEWRLASEFEVEQRPRAPAAKLAAPSSLAWTAGVLVLLAALLVQVMWFQRDELAGYPELRPWLERMCQVGGCELPLRRDPDRLSLLRGQVAEHPEVEAALVASATLVNQADFRQPYPLLKLTLLDDEQGVAGERWFHPSQYLDDPVQREGWRRGMPVQQPVAVRLSLRDPGTGPAQYVFDFR